MKVLRYLLALAATICVTACAYTNHFLDEDEEDTESSTDTGEDAAYYTLENLYTYSYSDWTYLNLLTGEYESHPDASEWIYAGTGDLREEEEEEEITIDWHVAVHRYDFKTNEASVLNTGYTDITLVTELPSGDYTADEETSYETEVELDDGYILSMDISGMMSGNIGYAHYPTINRVLCGTIVKTATGTMPPYLYSTTGEVFALKWDDGSWATFQVTAVSHTSTGVSAYLTFNYKYYTE